MMKVNRLTVILVLVLGFQTINANIDRCVNPYVARLQSEGFKCEIIKTYVKCILKEIVLSNPMLANEKYMKEFKAQFSSMQSQFGTDCDLELESIFGELEKEQTRANSSTTTTKEITDYKDPTTECLNMFFGVHNLTCSVVTPYLKCILRVMKVDVRNIDIDDSSYQHLERMLDNKLSQFGLKCDLDIKSKVNQMRQEKADEGHGSASSYRPLYLVTLITLTALKVVVL